MGTMAWKSFSIVCLYFGVVRDSAVQKDPATMFFNASGSDAYGEAIFESYVRGGKAFATSDKNELKELFEAAVRTNVALVE